MTKFALTLGILAAGLALGYSTQLLVAKQILRLPFPLAPLRRCLIKVIFLFVSPITVVGAIWIIKIEDARIFTLPVLGVSGVLFGGALALCASRFLKLERRKTGSLFVCGAFSNIGTIGGLTCYVFFGEPGFALMSIYKLLEDFVYFMVGFPIAKLYGTESGEREGLQALLKRFAVDPFILVSVASTLLGVALNGSGLERPVSYETVNAILIPVGAFVLIASIGLAMRLERIRDYLKEGITICVIKFLVLPAVMTLAAFLLGYGSIDDGLPLRVVLILSSMPVAFTALIPPSIYDLDLDLANSCWLLTTGLLSFVLPALYFATL